MAWTNVLTHNVPRRLILSHVTESWDAIGASETFSMLHSPRNTALILIPVMAAKKVDVFFLIFIFSLDCEQFFCFFFFTLKLLGRPTRSWIRHFYYLVRVIWEEQETYSECGKGGEIATAFSLIIDLWPNDFCPKIDGVFLI